MEQTDIFEASFYALKGFFYKLCRFMFPCTITYDFPVIEVNKDTYVIPVHPYPYIRQIAYYNIPVSPVMELAVQDIFCFRFIAGILLRFELCGCVIGNQPFLLQIRPIRRLDTCFPVFINSSFILRVP